MNNEQHAIIRASLCDILENFAFMFAEAPDDNKAPEGPCLAVRMSFAGPLRGTALLAVPATLAAELAANVLGVEPEEQQNPLMAMDALKELLNVATGNFVTALAGEEPVFDLSIPEPVAFNQDAWNALSETPGAIVLLVEDQPILLSVLL